jgi:hypothetical protein
MVFSISLSRPLIARQLSAVIFLLLNKGVGVGGNVSRCG